MCGTVGEDVVTVVGPRLCATVTPDGGTDGVGLGGMWRGGLGGTEDRYSYGVGIGTGGGTKELDGGGMLA